MLETSNSEINVDQLMYEIRERVARQQLDADENLSAPSDDASLVGKSGSDAQIDSSPLSLQPEFHPRPDNQYHVNDLLKYHGRDFVRNAYRAILKREPEAAGWARHLENLASGRFNKVDVLASLRYSPEGERAQVKIAGLTWPAAVRRMGRLPIIGYLIQMVIAVGRLPLLLQHQRQSEFHLSAQQQQIVEHDNQVHQQYNQVHQQLAESLSHIFAQISAGAEKAATQQQMIESLLQQQQDIITRQIELRNGIDARLAATRQHVDQSTAVLTQRVEHSTSALRQQLDQRIQMLTEQVEEQVQQLLRRQQQTLTELVMQERRLTLLLEKAREERAGAFAEPLIQLMANEEGHLLDALYASFEDRFRGDREEVKSRLRVYLPILKDAEVSGGVLDIGCGRGEWLELMKDEGVPGRGVDHNRVFVDQCRERGFGVVEEDALSYLRSLPDQSLSAITSFHLVEHLPFEVLIKLLDEIVRTLKPGGLVILETPDPENFMVGSCNFYTDPTHRNPIPSPTLQFLLEARGLFRIKVMKLRPWDAAKIEGDSEIIKRFNEYFYSSPDYGIIGWKV